MSWAPRTKNSALHTSIGEKFRLRVRSTLELAQLDYRSRHSTARVVHPSGPIVSLTSFGQRIKSVHITIESIARGDLLPSRLLLWLSHDDAFLAPTPALQSLAERGLEICFAEDYGPHKKYFPYIRSNTELALPLVTADDDVIYPRYWLRELTEAHFEAPEIVHCFRAHRLRLNDSGIDAYESWKPCTNNSPSLLNFSTGVSGAIYPPRLQAILRSAGDAFLSTCAKADDIWLHANELRNGIPVKQVRDHPVHFPLIPRTQSIGLVVSNVGMSANDLQITQTYTPEDIKRLRAVPTDDRQSQTRTLAEIT